MSAKRKPKKWDTGSVLIIALLVLMLLALIGVAAGTTASIEIRVAGGAVSRSAPTVADRADS